MKHIVGLFNVEYYSETGGKDDCKVCYLEFVYSEGEL